MGRPSEDDILVVGSDSLIGGSLMGFLRQAGETVIGTTRRPENLNESTFNLNLAGEPSSWEIPVSPSIAMLCAGVTSMRACSEDPVGSAMVNVSGIMALAERLISRGAFVVFLSTNQVFDGSLPMRSAGDAPCPASEYGRQKAEAENGIISYGDSAAVVRLTKVLHASDLLLSSWARHLRSNREVQPFSDLVFSPIPLESVLSVTYLAAKHRVAGITQVSGEKDITYEDAAYIGADALGAQASLVKPVTSSQANVSIEHLPQNTTLNMSRVRRMFGITTPNVEWTIKWVFGQIMQKYSL